MAGFHNQKQASEEDVEFSPSPAPVKHKSSLSVPWSSGTWHLLKALLLPALHGETLDSFVTVLCRSVNQQQLKGALGMPCGEPACGVREVGKKTQPHGKSVVTFSR